MSNPFLGEFFGTMVLILFGNGVVAGVVLENSKSKDSGWVVIILGWAIAVTLGIITAISLGSPGAHLNPAVTLGFAILNNDFSNVFLFWIAQIFGAYFGAMFVFLLYYPHFAKTKNQDKTLAVFSTIPAIRNYFFNFLSEYMGTLILLFLIYVIFSEPITKQFFTTNPFLQILLVGLLVAGIGLSFGGVTGYAINPARDLGPRIAHFILPVPNKGSSDWTYSWIPVVAPITAGLTFGILLKLI